MLRRLWDYFRSHRIAGSAFWLVPEMKPEMRFRTRFSKMRINWFGRRANRVAVPVKAFVTRKHASVTSTTSAVRFVTLFLSLTIFDFFSTFVQNIFTSFRCLFCLLACFLTYLRFPRQFSDLISGQSMLDFMRQVMSHM